MKANGSQIKHTVKGDLYTQTAIFMKAVGKKTKPMGSVYIHMLMAPCTKESGSLINNTESAQRLGPMEPPSLESSVKAKNMGKDASPGLISPHSMEASPIIAYMESGPTYGLMAKSMLEGGKIM